MCSDRVKKGALIIIVDDDPLYIKFWKRLLGELAIDNIITTTDPIEAKKLIEEKKCDILISDVIMPHSSGYELAKLAHEINPECKVILTTAYSPYLSRFDLLRPHFYLLPKPYGSIWALGKLVRKLVDGDDDFDEMGENSFGESEEYPEVVEWKI